MPRQRGNRRKSRRTTVRQAPQTSLLKDIRHQLELRNVKDNHVSLERVPDVPRIYLKRNKIYTFSRRVSYGALTSASAIGSFGSVQFLLSNLPNFGDFVNVFDQYRILQVTVVVLPNSIQANIPIYTAIDYDDGSIPTTINEMYEKDTCRVSSSDQVIERTLQPRVLREVYESLSSSGYEVAPAGTWIDSSESNVPHYGLKYFIAAIPTSGLINTYSISADFIVQTRSVT